MKTNNKPAVDKMMIRFDDELKALLANDLSSFMARNPFFARRKNAQKVTLSVA
jgi:hypothetical protein